MFKNNSIESRILSRLLSVDQIKQLIAGEYRQIIPFCRLRSPDFRTWSHQKKRPHSVSRRYLQPRRNRNAVKMMIREMLIFLYFVTMFFRRFECRDDVHYGFCRFQVFIYSLYVYRRHMFKIRPRHCWL